MSPNGGQNKVFWPKHGFEEAKLAILGGVLLQMAHSHIGLQVDPKQPRKHKKQNMKIAEAADQATET